MNRRRRRRRRRLFAREIGPSPGVTVKAPQKVVPVSRKGDSDIVIRCNDLCRRFRPTETPSKSHENHTLSAWRACSGRPCRAGPTCCAAAPNHSETRGSRRWRWTGSRPARTSPFRCRGCAPRSARATRTGPCKIRRRSSNRRWHSASQACGSPCRAFPPQQPPPGEGGPVAGSRVTNTALASSGGSQYHWRLRTAVRGVARLCGGSGSARTVGTAP